MLPGVRSVGYWNADHDQDWRLPEHRNEGIELTYLETGHLAFCAEGHSFELDAGDLTVTRPWQPHSVGNPFVHAGKLHWLILDVGVRQPHQPWKWPDWLVLSPNDIRELTDMLRHNEQPVWPGTAEVGHCFKEIGRMVEKRGESSTLASRMAIHVNELFLCLLEMLRQQSVPRKPELATAERTVKMFLASLPSCVADPWTLDAMAEHTGLKRTRFAHYCRKLTNRTPMQFLNDLRVAKAKELIKTASRRNLTEIGLECGFATSQYFATVFRRVTGKTPREYRREECSMLNSQRSRSK